MSKYVRTRLVCQQDKQGRASDSAASELLNAANAASEYMKKIVRALGASGCTIFWVRISCPYCEGKD